MDPTTYRNRDERFSVSSKSSHETKLLVATEAEDATDALDGESVGASTSVRGAGVSVGSEVVIALMLQEVEVRWLHSQDELKL